jgi:hypothetical protein
MHKNLYQAHCLFIVKKKIGLGTSLAVGDGIVKLKKSIKHINMESIIMLNIIMNMYEALAWAYLCLNKDQTRRFDTSKIGLYARFGRK